MTLIIIRHAHRDTAVRALDNGLSKKGKSQARRLLKYFRKRFGTDTKNITLMSSPKKRCMETLEPIAQFLGTEVSAAPLLLEQEKLESASSLERRVQKFLKQSSTMRGTLVICSHGDWIPLALKAACGATAAPGKGSWIEIEGEQLIRLLEPEDI
jgi:8-oxo-dGTP diphosphatase